MKSKLARSYPDDVEDVAIETVKIMVEKVPTLKSLEEIKPLTASIAYKLAISWFRKKLAEKRGGGKVDSLDETKDGMDGHSRIASTDSPLSDLHQKDLAKLLTELKKDMKAEHRGVFKDFFTLGLTYEQISQKRSIPSGTVGVYLKRALDAIRQAGKRRPELMKELEAFAQ